MPEGAAGARNRRERHLRTLPPRPALRGGAADAGGEFGGQFADRRDALVIEEAADEGGADDHAVRETGHLGRLGAVADAEAHGYRQVRVLADPPDQAGSVGTDRVPGAGDAHQRGGVDETAAGAGDL